MTPRSVFVHLLPSLVEPEAMTGGVAVVIDILRASSTIVHALGNGGVRVIPCREVEEAKKVANGLTLRPLLGGERHGTMIPGFDLDNSPRRYSKKVCGGKTIVFTTTNGTRALARCRAARRVLIGSFCNLTAICRELEEETGAIHLVCAGTDGNVTLEDVLFAGTVYRRLKKACPELTAGNDSCLLASQFAKVTTEEKKMILRVFEGSLGGKNLLEVGFGEDLERCAEFDLFKIVPEWDVRENTISVSGE